MSRTLSVVAVSLILLAASCGGASNLGESCGAPGSLDECVAGTICTNIVDANICYEICVSQEDCPLGWNCNGVANTNIKSCQPI